MLDITSLTKAISNAEISFDGSHWLWIWLVLLKNLE